jgi:hypothetical protein
VTRVYRVLTRHESDIRRNPGKPFALDRAKGGKIETPTISSAVTTAGTPFARRSAPSAASHEHRGRLG